MQGGDRVAWSLQSLRSLRAKGRVPVVDIEPRMAVERGNVFTWKKSVSMGFQER